MTAAPPQIARIAHPDFTQDLDLTIEELSALLDLAAELKRAPGDYRQSLTGKSIALLFEKPSLRTRMTFELAIQQLGGFGFRAARAGLLRGSRIPHPPKPGHDRGD